MNPLRIIFAGTPVFAVPVLQRLYESQHQIVAVYTQPDRPKGRGQHVQSSPIKLFAQTRNLPVFLPTTLKDAQVAQALTVLAPDLMIVIAYGLLLPPSILKIPRLGCLNIHASLLPRWRGASPMQYALLSGDKETGVSLMKMVEKLDAGPVIAQKKYVVSEKDTFGSLQNHLAELAADLLIEKLNGDLDYLIKTASPQDESKVTFAPKIKKEDYQINWALSANQLTRVIRAYYPNPIAYTHFQNKVIRVWEAKSIAGKSLTAPGSLSGYGKDYIDIATGEGNIRILMLQLPGRRVQPVSDFINANRHALILGQPFFY